MPGKIKTLVLEANGSGWKVVTAETFLKGIYTINHEKEIPGIFKRIPFLKKKIIKFLRNHYDPLSYVNDWKDAIVENQQLDVTSCNINNLVEYQHFKKCISSYPLVIILHTAAGDSMSILHKTRHWFQKRQGKLVVFLGNEYDLMDEKIGFIKSVGADFLCSQLPVKTALWIYEHCKPTKILSMPHALNPKLYYNQNIKKRNIDIGFIGAIYGIFIGDIERTRLIYFLENNADKYHLNCDIRKVNIPRREWADFLRKCKGIIGAESGTYYLDRKGKLILDAKRYMKKNPDTSLEELCSLFFESPREEVVSAKCISSRHFEPIGTKTCQLLLEGDYNDILIPNKHYIPVKKDVSNFDESIRMFKDDEYRNRIVNEAFNYTMSEHTYSHRISSLIKSLSFN